MEKHINFKMTLNILHKKYFIAFYFDQCYRIDWWTHCGVRFKDYFLAPVLTEHSDHSIPQIRWGWEKSANLGKFCRVWRDWNLERAVQIHLRNSALQDKDCTPWNKIDFSSIPNSVTCYLCELGQITQGLWSSIFSFINVINNGNLFGIS